MGLVEEQKGRQAAWSSVGGTEQDMASKTWKNAQPCQHVLQLAGGPIRNLNFNNKEKDDLGERGEGSIRDYLSVVFPWYIKPQTDLA